ASTAAASPQPAGARIANERREDETHGATGDLPCPLERTATPRDPEDGARTRQRTDEEDHADGRVPGREEPEAREDEAYPEDQEHHERGGHGIARAPEQEPAGPLQVAHDLERPGLEPPLGVVRGRQSADPVLDAFEGGG